MIFHLPEAHALVAKQDLPIPAWLFAWAASIVLIISFFALSAAWRKPKFEQERWRPVAPGFSRLLLSTPAQVLCGAIGVSLLGFSIYAGLRGTEAPDRNFALTFIYVTAWLGFPLFSVIFGDVFRPFNPWRAVGRARADLATQWLLLMTRSKPSRRNCSTSVGKSGRHWR